MLIHKMTQAMKVLVLTFCFFACVLSQQSDDEKFAAIMSHQMKQSNPTYKSMEARLGSYSIGENSLDIDFDKIRFMSDSIAIRRD